MSTTACSNLTKGRQLQCDRIAGGIKNVYFGVYDDFDANAGTGEILGTGIIITGTAPNQEVTDINMASGSALRRYSLPRGESSFTETIVGSTENGTVHYTPQITIKLNHLSTADQNELKLLSTVKLVIFAELNQLKTNGKNVILCMGIRNGMRLNSGTNLSGAGFGDHNGYSWTFDGMEEDVTQVVADYDSAPFDNSAFGNVTVDIS